MIIYTKVTEIFCLVDEFCKEYDKIVNRSLLGNPSKRPSIMRKSEVITLCILFQLSGFRTFKHFYIFYVQKHMKSDFPATVSYNRFTEFVGQNLMAMSDKILLRKRSIIETVNDELKNICQIEHSRHRSFTNFLSNIVAGLIAYSFLPKKPAIK